MQGQLARSEGRDEMKTSKPFGFDRFSVSDSKLSPSACVFLFFLRSLRGTNADESEEEVQKMPVRNGSHFFHFFFLAVKNSSVFFLQKALKAQRKKARKLVKVFVISSGGSIHKSHRDFFYGEKN